MREYLKKLRRDSLMTQGDVAKQLNLSREHYCRIEKGERQKDLDLSFVVKLSDIFKVSTEFIISEEEKIKRERR